MEESSTVQVTCIGPEIFLVDIISLLPTKATFYTGVPWASQKLADLTKPLRLKSLTPKQMAKVKQHAGISGVHFGPRDPACSSRLSNTVTAYSPRGQAECWVAFVVVFIMCTSPSFRGMLLTRLRKGGGADSCTRCFFFQALMPQH